MPYIRKVDRTKFKKHLEEIPIPKDVGELNYLITCICQLYLVSEGESYKTHNDIEGVLECVKKEWYRRLVVPYEEKKIKENGDVYNIC